MRPFRVPCLSLLVTVVLWHEVTSFQSARPHLGRRPVSESPWPLNLAEIGPQGDKDYGPSRKKEFAPGELFHDALLRLAELSLEDYKWRSSVFKTREADRMMEESIARMQGKDASYIRPMDAGEEKIGPLGRLEKAVVEWLSKVIDEEARRAERIINSDGLLVRPIDADEQELGPLGYLEKQWVDFIQRIQSSEKERVRTRTLRPKDLEETIRGPLGNLELKIVGILREIEASERLRMQQSQLRGGEIVRPIDVPGPLGEIELAVSELFWSEQDRAKAIEKSPGTIIRPKDARLPGPLGAAESWAYDVLEALRIEENERLRSIETSLKENRPMEADRQSVLGFLETLAVGIIRAPVLLISTIGRVQELLSSQSLNDEDMDVIRDSNSKESSASRREDETKP